MDFSTRSRIRGIWKRRLCDLVYTENILKTVTDIQIQMTGDSCVFKFLRLSVYNHCSENKVWLHQFRYHIKIQPWAMHFSTRLWEITTEFVGFIPLSLMLGSIVIAWSLIPRNWSIKGPVTWATFFFNLSLHIVAFETHCWAYYHVCDQLVLQQNTAVSIVCK